MPVDRWIDCLTHACYDDVDFTLEKVRKKSENLKATGEW